MTHRRPAFVVQTLGVKTNFPTAPRQFIYPKCESWASSRGSPERACREGSGDDSRIHPTGRPNLLTC